MFINSPRKKFFIFGPPGVGKTTLIEYLFQFIKTHLTEFKISGFITQEIREKGRRKGFKIKILDTEDEFLLAIKKDFIKEEKNRPLVGKYVVMIENLEKVVDFLKKKEKGEEKIFIIDEIGKMEILSEKFCYFIQNLLNSSLYLLATVGKGETNFLKKIKNYEPAYFCEVNKENRDFLKKRLELEFLRKGKLIVVEGIDGAGKTTFSRALYEELKKIGVECLISSEPTSGPFGEKIREILRKGEVNLQELKSLFLKDRIWHVENIIIPALEESKVLILDRYYLSTLAYQTSQGLSFKQLLIENETIAPTPDLVFYLDISLETAFERIKACREKLSFFEKRDFLKKVKENYERILKYFDYSIINAEKPIKENIQFALKVLNSKFKSAFS